VSNPVEPTAALQPREEPELKPQTDREIRAIPPKAETKSVFRKPPTEFLKNPRGTSTDGTGSEPETKSVFRKPPTTSIPRPKHSDEGFTVVEVMISLAVLATVMAATASSMFTLRQVQRSSREHAQVEQLAHTLADRILGASWDWIGRETSDPTDDSHGAWSWHRRQSPTAVVQPLTETATVPTDNLMAIHLLNAPSGIANLKVYVEYYRIDALTAAFAWSLNRGADNNPAAAWERARADNRNWYAEPPQLGLGQTADDSLTVRIAITWDGVEAAGRSFELVFARRK
jgi:prepilin-type N-terminal cleavage/methylation domain-containing protein